MEPESSGRAAISVSVTLTFREYLKLNAVVTFRRLRGIAVLGIFFVLAYAVLPLMLPEDETSTATNYFKMLPALIIPALAYVVLPAVTYIAARNRWNSTPELREPMTYIFTDAEFDAATLDRMFRLG